MACTLLWSSAVRVHDSQATRRMDMTREPISRITPHTLNEFRTIIIRILIIIMVIFKRLSLKALSASQDHEGGGGNRVTK